MPPTPDPTLHYAGPTTPRPHSRWPRHLAIAAAILFLLATVISLLIPSGHGRGHMETRNRVRCASNLKQLGSALLMYSNAHANRYPPTLEALLPLTQFINPQAFACPSSADTPAPGPTPQAQAAALATGGHLSYVYVGAGLTNAENPNTVVAYEHSHNHARDGLPTGLNVLFADGHVEWIPLPQARAFLDLLAAGHPHVLYRGPGQASIAPATRPSP